MHSGQFGPAMLGREGGLFRRADAKRPAQVAFDEGRVSTVGVSSAGSTRIS